MKSRPWQGERTARGLGGVKEGDNFPVVHVNWTEATEFCRKISVLEGRPYRLPTEAEWEYACRSGTETAYCFGNDPKKLTEYAWFQENTRMVRNEYAHMVATKRPNPFGLFDMHGNVWNWCLDAYVERAYDRKTGSNIDPFLNVGEERVLRGGTWYHSADYARSAKRHKGAKTATSSDLGFRVAISLPSDMKTAPTLVANPQPGNVWHLPSPSIEFVWCPPGNFRMGSGERPLPDANEAPVDVMLSQGLWVAKREVTQAQWKAVMGTEPWKAFKDHRDGANHAASHVTWTESVEFCRKLTETEHKAGTIAADWKFRLPTEAEWEYLARAGTTTRFSFGNDSKLLSEHAWWRDNADAKGEKYAHEVGKFKPNPWGLHDIHGNVYEWCQDTFTAGLPGGVDPLVSQSGNTSRINRGGGWDGRDELAHTSSNRRWTSEYDRRNNLGLRVVLGNN